MVYVSLSKSKRFLNFLIDSFIVAVVNGIWITAVYFDESKKTILLDSYHKRLYYLMLLVIYYITFEYLFNKTISKFITKSKVVTLNMEKPSFPQIVIRTFLRFIPFEAFSFLHMGKGWHDLFSKTIVVEDSRDSK